MSYIVLIWSIAGAGALVIGLIHLLVWAFDRNARANLAFALAAFGLASFAVCELGIMSAQTPAEWGGWVWRAHFPMTVYILAIAAFLRLRLNAGSLWLLAALFAARSAVLILNAGADVNFNFERIDALREVRFLGESVSVVAQATVNRYQWLGTFATVLLIAFVTNVVVAVWRRGTPDARRQAVFVAAPVLLALGIAGIVSQLVIWDVLQTPFLITPPYLIALIAISAELIRDLLRASRLSLDLRESEQRLALAANAAGIGLWSWDAASHRIWATERARSMLNLDATKDIERADVLSSVDPHDVGALHAVVSTALSSGGVHTLRFRAVTPGAHTRWIDAQGAVEMNAAGKPVRARGVLRDITERVQAEEESSDLRRKLAHAGRVTMLGQLSSGLAHELSQPLSAIRQNAEAASMLLAKEHPDLEELRAIVHDIVRDDLRAAQVLQRLRSWLTQGRVQLEPISVRELVSDVLALVRAEAIAKRVTLECAAADSLPLVVGDRVQLSQVLLNLIINAMDSVVEAGDARRRVRIEAQPAPDRCCEISVNDTGAGVPSDKLDEIFEPFFTGKAEGLGLGLSISRTIVESHGGRLWAENDARGGATFRFTVRTCAPVAESELLQQPA